MTFPNQNPARAIQELPDIANQYVRKIKNYIADDYEKWDEKLETALLFFVLSTLKEATMQLTPLQYRGVQLDAGAALLDSSTRCRRDSMTARVH